MVSSLYSFCLYFQNGGGPINRSNPFHRGGGAVATVAPLSVSYWFTEPQFYLVALLYMATRLFVNLSQAYMPLFIQVMGWAWAGLGLVIEN